MNPSITTGVRSSLSLKKEIDPSKERRVCMLNKSHSLLFEKKKARSKLRRKRDSKYTSTLMLYMDTTVFVVVVVNLLVDFEEAAVDGTVDMGFYRLNSSAKQVQSLRQHRRLLDTRLAALYWAEEGKSTAFSRKRLAIDFTFFLYASSQLRLQLIITRCSPAGCSCSFKPYLLGAACTAFLFDELTLLTNYLLSQGPPAPLLLQLFQ